MLTAVTKHVGALIPFNEAFLTLLRSLAILLRAHNLRNPHEKGVIHYMLHNFWPLCSFKNLPDLRTQAEQWRDSVANVRINGTTAQRPIGRFQPQALRRLH